MLGRRTNTTDLDELSLEVYGRPFNVVGVSEVNPVPANEALMQMFRISFTWGISGTLRGIYLIVQNVNIPLIIQPHIISFLFAISWAQVIALPCREIFCVVEAVYSVCFMATSGR